jgi:transposase
MGKPAVTIVLEPWQRAELERLVRGRGTGQALARRARIVLAAAEGLENKTICTVVGADANTVGKWRRRFAALGVDGLYDEPRPGAPREIGDEAIADLIHLTLETKPANAVIKV